MVFSFYCSQNEFTGSFIETQVIYGPSFAKGVQEGCGWEGHSDFSGQTQTPSIRVSEKGMKIPGKCWLKREGSIEVSICWRQQEAELNLYEKQM